MFRIDLKGDKELEMALIKKSKTDYDEVAKKSLRDIFRRAKKPYTNHVGTSGGTPKDSGELMGSIVYDNSALEVGYVKDYAPHVEYGHRTKNGGWVPGQFYLKSNVDLQRPIYHEDLKNKLKEK